MGVVLNRQVMTTDASNLGWGAVWEGRGVDGTWLGRWTSLHINILELQAVLLSFPQIPLLLAFLEGVQLDKVTAVLVAPRWPRRIWFSTLYLLLQGQPWEIPLCLDLLSGERHSLASGIGQVPIMGLAPERNGWSASGLSDVVVGTLQNARQAPLGHYTPTSGDIFGTGLTKGHDPVSCPMPVILQFLQELLEAGNQGYDK
ncbi:UNVERIFIED_CONTAM: hypothetical protein FKN15_043919 [Acipenser sinensis]